MIQQFSDDCGKWPWRRQTGRERSWWVGMSLFSVFLMVSLCHKHCNEMLAVGVLPGELSRKEPLSWEQYNKLGVSNPFRVLLCVIVVIYQHTSISLSQELQLFVISVYLRHFLTSLDTLVLLTPGHANCFSRGHHHRSWAREAAGGS